MTQCRSIDGLPLMTQCRLKCDLVFLTKSRSIYGLQLMTQCRSIYGLPLMTQCRIQCDFAFLTQSRSIYVIDINDTI